MSGSQSIGPGSHAPPTAPSLDVLVGHFVAAKKSLASTSHVYRANEIVEDARALIEEAAVLKSKNTYVRNGVQEQVRILRNIHGGLEAVGLEAQIDFQAVIKSLDVANDRLQVTLSSLRSTIVSATLGASQQLPHGSTHEEHDEQVELEVAPEEKGTEKTLYDFIDETTHVNLLDSLRSTIDSYNDAQAALHKVRTALGEALEELNATLDDIKDSSYNPGAPDDFAGLFHSLTSDATEMASLLQSLISHYDLCITALKHTEGGGEAARAATSATSDLAPLSSGADSPTEASLYAGADAEAHRAPLSPSEKEEMLSVLAADAAQVDDVVLELRDRGNEMSSSLDSISAATSHARARAKALEGAITRLASLASTLLPSAVGAAHAFRAQWSELRATLVDRTAALADLASFHDAFLAAYAGLLREVERRAMLDAKMRRIAVRARKDIDALRAEDADMRAQFLRDVGDWLPRDIWPGLVDAPPRWEVRRVKERGLGIEVPGAEGRKGES